MAGDSTTIAESEMTSTAAKKAKKKSTAEKKRGLQKSATTSHIPLDKSNLHILDLGRIRRCPNCLRTHDSRVSCEEYQSKCQMIIRENVPKELPSDVVRCNSKSDAGLESLPQINLSSLRQRFESGSESENDINDNNITIGGSNGDINGNGYQRRSSKPLDLQKYGLSRSETVLIRLQRYQSIARGDYRPTMDIETSVDTNHEDKTTNGHENGDHGEEEEHVSKRKEKAVPFARLSALKSQWESGVIVNDDDEDDDNEKTNGHNGNHENGDDDLTKNGDVKEELYKLRQRICLGRSASMRQIYERGLVNNNNNEIVPNKMSVVPMNAHLNAINAGLNGKIEAEVIESAKDKARKVREKFEKGITNGDDINGGNASDDPDGSSDGDSKLSQLKREKLTDLSVVVEAETAAREAKKIFKHLDQLSLQEKEKDLVNSHRRRVIPSSAKNVQRSSTIANFQTRSPSSQNGDTGINGTTNGTAAAGHASSSDVVDSVVCPSNGETLLTTTHPQPPVIRYCDPVESEDILIDTQQLQERYKFFEEFKEQLKEPKRFEMTPPRDQVGKKEATKDDDKEPPRDPNVVRCLDVIDDIPKTDTTKKMLGVFKQLESQAAAAGTSSPVHGPSRDGAPGTPKPLKRITPPRELADKTDVVDVNNKVASVIKSGLAGDTEVVKSSTKTEDVIPVEPEMTRSLKAKFENWANEVNTTTSEVNGNKSYDLPDDYTPSLDMAKNLKAKFESISSSPTSDTAAIDKSASSTTVDGGKRKPRVNRFVWGKRGHSESSLDSSSSSSPSVTPNDSSSPSFLTSPNLSVTSVSVVPLSSASSSSSTNTATSSPIMKSMSTTSTNITPSPVKAAPRRTRAAALK